MKRRSVDTTIGQSALVLPAVMMRRPGAARRRFCSRMRIAEAREGWRFSVHGAVGSLRQPEPRELKWRS